MNSIDAPDKVKMAKVLNMFSKRSSNKKAAKLLIDEKSV